MRICVFCSSSNHIADEYKQMAIQFGRKIAGNGHVLVYGGATGGLMDAVAEGAVEKKGEIIGVIPEIIIRSNRQSKFPTQLIIMSDMAGRKNRMKQESDVFVVLPGGYGTLDEMFDVIASGTVGEHKKPLICLNINGFYNSLIDQTIQMKKNLFIPLEESYKPHFVQSIDECFEVIENL
ncbi:MAG: LOG family protein [Paludibacteraceae bacterium]